MPAIIRTILFIEAEINACSIPPMDGLYLTCTEGIFSFNTGHTYYMF
jgi:hypothetical protein